MLFDVDALLAALSQLGRLLAARNQHFVVTVIGGSALLLGGWISRPTVDVDVVGLGDRARLEKARPLPPALREAVEDVAATRGLPATWLNSGPTDLLDWGLPDGFFDRCDTRFFDGLTVHVAGRLDLICTKLYAVADQGSAGRHIDDLRALAPGDDDLQFAARWTRTQDPSVEFAAIVEQVLRHFGVEGTDGG